MPITLIKQKPDFDKRVEGEDKLAISEMFADTIQGEGVSAGLPATFIRLQGCTLKCVWCFKDGTRIHTRDRGIIPIEQVVEGDILLTLDNEGGVVETIVQKVLISQIDPNRDLLCVRLKRTNHNRIYVTHEHPFMVKGKGWVRAQDLKSDDILLGLEGHQYNQYQMQTHNPSFDAEILEKGMRTQREMRNKGLIVPYERSVELKRSHSVRMKKNNPSFDAEIHRRSSQNRFKGPSKLEQKYIEFFELNNYPIRYVGNNQLSIGDSEYRYRFPDFLVNGKLKVIEIYDTTAKYVDYKSQKRFVRDKSWENETRDFYTRFGYEVLFLTQNDLRIRNRQLLNDKLFDFVFNGVVVESIDYSLTVKQRARLWGTSNVSVTSVYNFECFPHNTYLAEGCLVHNCDTLDVWPEGNEYSFNEVLDMLEPFKYKYLEGQRLVLTGGSPIKQQKRLIGFIKAFIDRFDFIPFIEVENEAVLMPHVDLVPFVHQWNNSPKLANSGMKPRVRIKPDVIRVMNSLKNSWFKFVISNQDEWEEIVRDYLPYIDRNKIILMPEGVTQEELNEAREFVADMAIEHNVRFSDRLHVTIWNKKTGV